MAAMRRGLITKQEMEIILNSSHDGMIAVNQAGIVTIFNRAAERIMGLEADGVIGRPVVDVIPNTRLHIVLAEGKPELNQQQQIGKSFIITNRMPVLSKDGQIMGAVAVFRDITEIETLTKQVSDLWKVRNLLEAVIDATEDAISVADERGINIIVNPAYTRITGLPKEAVINKHVTVDIAEGESMHMKVLRTGKRVHNVRLKVGPLKKEVIVNVAPVYVNGKIHGSVGVIHDISEIMALNQELAKAKKLIRHLKARYTFEDIIGNSESLAYAKEQALRAAHTPATVLLRGDSGTGKELFAHAIHNASSRRRGQFVRVNCAALAESILESELFGYEAGAFTGALNEGRKGLFEEANGGTIFLDEIGEIGLPLQRKLLRVVQEKEFVRVGGTRPVPVDVRVIAATNANLEEKIRASTFREDLYYRINVIPIYTPPLSKRREDIPSLVEHLIFKINQEFGRQVQRVSDEVIEYLKNCDWPGNVRELENFLGRAMINMRLQDVLLEKKHLPPMQIDKKGSIELHELAAFRTLSQITAEAERFAILKALAETRGNRTKAAMLLGIAVRSFYYKLKRHDLV